MSTAAVIGISVSVMLFIGIALWMRFHWFIYRSTGRREIPVTPRRLLYSLYSLLVFLCMVYIVAFPATFLYFAMWKKNEKRLYRYHKFLRWSSEFIINNIPGTDYTYRNLTGETFEKPAVIICNHQGHFDLMCIMMTTPRLVVLTNDWVWRNPLYGWIIKRAEFYPVSNGLDANLPRLRSLVERGYSVVIFPEGTRSDDCRILRFHSGAFYLAQQLGVDILPMLLHGVGHVIPKNDFMLRPGHMYLEVGERVVVEQNDDPLYIRNLTRSVRRKYVERYAEVCRQLETSGYFAPYVKYKYRYLPVSSYRRCCRLLRRNYCYSDVVDRMIRAGSTVVVDNASIGVLPWLLAYVHPEVEVIGVIYAERDLQIANSTPAHRSNLRFTRSFPETYDMKIALADDGSVSEIDIYKWSKKEIK